MAIVRKKRCLRCMEELGNNDICVSCGYDNTIMDQAYDDALPMGTLLADMRYLVGEVVHRNGQGFKYIGYDYENDIKVWIEEFMPITLAERLTDEDEVLPKEDKETQFKTFQLDFSDINMTLLNMENKKGLFPVIDCFEQNNTIYSVIQYIESISLSELLKEDATLNTKQTLAIFNPVFHTLSRLHNHNLVHRGLSLDTIYIDTSGDLRLADFAISSVRTLNSELDSELFPGYTAPEQYDVTEMQGTWTDVYSISAVLYRTLSGVVPVPADKRDTKVLRPISVVTNNLPDSVIYSITQGLIIEPDKRIKSMDTFIEFIHYGPEATEGADMTKRVDMPGVAAALEEEENNTKNPKKSRSNKTSKNRKKSKDKKDKKKKSARTTKSLSKNGDADKKEKATTLMTVSLVVTAIVGILAIGILVFNLDKLFGEPARKNSSSSESSESSSSIDDENEDKQYIMSSFVGRYIDMVNNDKYFGKAFDVEIEYENNEKYSENVIISQSIEPGTKIDYTNGPEKMLLKVSKGPVELPEMENMPVETAKGILEENNIEYTIREVYSQEIHEGCVVSIRRNSNNTVLMVSKGPKETSGKPSSGGSQGGNQSSGPAQSESSDDNYWNNW